MAHDVFISHSSSDKATADTVCAILESSGLRCWVAPRDIRPGETWAGSIFKAVCDSRTMVIILSKHANTSKHVMREVELAVKNDVVIVPFRTEDVEPAADLAYFLSSTHWLDAITPPLEARIKDLAGCIQGLLGDRVVTSQGAAPRPSQDRSRQTERTPRKGAMTRCARSTDAPPEPPDKVGWRDEQDASFIDADVIMSSMDFGQPIMDFDVLPRTDGVVICGIDEAYVIMSLQAGDSKTLSFANAEGMCCAVSPDGSLVAIGTCFASVELYSTDTSELVRILRRDPTEAERCRFDEIGARDESFDYGVVRFSPCGNLIAAGRRLSERDAERIFYPHSIDPIDEPVDVFRLSGEFLYSLPGYGCTPQIGFSSEGKHLVLGLEHDGDDNFFVYHAATGKNQLRRYLNGFVRDVVASPSTNQVIVAIAGSGGDAIRSLSVRSGMARLALSYEPIPDDGRYPCTERIAVHPNSRLLTSAHNCGRLRLWNLQRETVIRTWQSNPSGLWIRCLQFSGDGSLLIASLEKLSGSVPTTSLSWVETADII